MNDLFRSTVSRDDFQRWLGLGTAPLTIYQGEKAAATLLRLEKNPAVEYLYQTAAQDSNISWNNQVLFCGVYDRKNRALYHYIAYPKQELDRPYDGIRLPADMERLGWSVRLKLASEAVPDGAWVKLPDYNETGGYGLSDIRSHGAGTGSYTGADDQSGGCSKTAE